MNSLKWCVAIGPGLRGKRETQLVSVANSYVFNADRRDYYLTGHSWRVQGLKTESAPGLHPGSRHYRG